MVKRDSSVRIDTKNDEGGMKILGIILLGLGISIVGKNIIQIKGHVALLHGYKNAKLEGREPSLDERYAYTIQMARKIGLYLVIFGGATWVVGFLSEGAA